MPHFNATLRRSKASQPVLLLRSQILKGKELFAGVVVTLKRVQIIGAGVIFICVKINVALQIN